MSTREPNSEVYEFMCCVSAKGMLRDDLFTFPPPPIMQASMENQNDSKRCLADLTQKYKKKWDEEEKIRFMDVFLAGDYKQPRVIIQPLLQSLIKYSVEKISPVAMSTKYLSGLIEQSHRDFCVYQAKLEKILKTFSPVRLVQKETVEKLAQIEHKLKDLLSFRSEQPVDVPQEVPADNAEKKNLIAAMKSKEKIYENAAATLRSCEKKRIAAETTLASATSMYAKAAVESEEANRRAAEVNGKKKGGAISKEAAKLQKKTDDLRGNMNAAKTACDDATLAACEARNKETEAKRVLDAAAVQVENLAPMSARSETSDSSFSLSDSVSNGVARSQSGEKTNVSAFVSACSEYKNVSSSMTNHVKSPVFDCETGVDTVAFNMAVSVVNRCILLVNWHLLAQEGEKFQWGHAELKEKEVTIQGLYDRLSLSDIIDLAAASVFDLRKFYGRIIDRAIHADIIFTQMKTIQASASMLVQIAEESRKSGFIVTPSQENKALFNRNAEHLEDCVSALEAIENSITHAHYAIVNSKVDEHKKTLESFDGLLYALARTKYFFANK